MGCQCGLSTRLACTPPLSTRTPLPPPPHRPPPTQVTVLADATASATDEVQAANLFDMTKVGVDTPTVAEWGAQLRGGATAAAAAATA